MKYFMQTSLMLYDKKNLKLNFIQLTPILLALTWMVLKATKVFTDEHKAIKYLI